jgi:PDZ domain
MVFAASVVAVSATDSPLVMDAVTVKAPASKECHIAIRLKYILWGSISKAEFDRVDPASVVAKSGIKSGDRVHQIDGRPVQGMSMEDFIQLLSRTNSTVRLQVGSGLSENFRIVQIVFPPNYWIWNMDNPKKASPIGTPTPPSTDK